MNGKTDESGRGFFGRMLNHVLGLLQPEKMRGQKWPLWVGVLGAAVLLVLGAWDDVQAEAPMLEVQQNTVFAAEIYEKTLEDRLTALLLQVEGAGEVTVMVTLESGMQAVYAQTVQQSTDTSKTQQEEMSERSSYSAEYVLVESGGDKQALTETTLQPTVKGVAVVCTGAEDVHVVSRITELVSTVLGIPSNRICVTN